MAKKAVLLAVAAATLWTGLATRRVWTAYHGFLIAAKSSPETLGVDPRLVDAFLRSTRSDPLPVALAALRRPWRRAGTLRFYSAAGASAGEATREDSGPWTLRPDEAFSRTLLKETP